MASRAAALGDRVARCRGVGGWGGVRVAGRVGDGGRGLEFVAAGPGVGCAMIGWGLLCPALVRFPVRPRRGEDLAGDRRSSAAGIFRGPLRGVPCSPCGPAAYVFSLGRTEDGQTVGERAGEIEGSCSGFLSASALAERKGVRGKAMRPKPSATSVKAADITARKARRAFGTVAQARPHRKVLRMHLRLFLRVRAWGEPGKYRGLRGGLCGLFFRWRLGLRPARERSGWPGG